MNVINEKMYNTNLIDVEEWFTELIDMGTYRRSSIILKTHVKVLEDRIKKLFNFDRVSILLIEEGSGPVIETITTDKTKELIAKDLLHDLYKNKKDLIKDFIFVINTKAISIFNNKELTSAMLHEIGHLKSYGRYRKLMLDFTDDRGFNKDKLEFHADNYAVRHGYSKELKNVIDVMSKYNNRVSNTSRNSNIRKILKYEKTQWK